MKREKAPWARHPVCLLKSIALAHAVCIVKAGPVCQQNHPKCHTISLCTRHSLIIYSRGCHGCGIQHGVLLKKKKKNNPLYKCSFLLNLSLRMKVSTLFSPLWMFCLSESWLLLYFQQANGFESFYFDSPVHSDYIRVHSQYWHKHFRTTLPIYLKHPPQSGPV